MNPALRDQLADHFPFGNNPMRAIVRVVKFAPRIDAEQAVEWLR
jgi:hypothetical protein